LLWSVLGLGLLLGACTPLGLAIGAGAAVGAAAVQERGIEGTTSDAAIRVEINRLWFEADHTLFSGVYLQIQEGRVLLSGSVPDPETRVQVIELTWRATGVREVINEIEVADDSTWSDYAQDSWIVAQLKSKLVVDQEVLSLNYSIEAVNGAVYLMGVAQDQSELDRVVAHAKDLAYVRQVVSYVRLKDDPTRDS
jgi:osmotically-inducible protein OsmY